MQFEKCKTGWQVSFYDLKHSPADFRKLTFADAAKVEELVARTATRMVAAEWRSFENCLRNGSGTVTIAITEEQYRMLLRR
jgi:hypothetical protein